MVAATRAATGDCHGITVYAAAGVEIDDTVFAPGIYDEGDEYLRTASVVDHR